MNGKLKIVLCGIGLIGRKHIDLIVKSNSSELIGIVAPKNDSNLTVIESLGLIRFDTLQNAFDQLEVDAVIIASPNEFHFDQTMCCLENKTPVLVEKPLTTNLCNAKILCEKSEETNTSVLVGHHRTYSNILPIAQKFIKSNLFGEPVAVQGAALFRKPENYFNDGQWRKFSGGGPIFINLIHDIGILQYLFGTIDSVWAISSNARRHFEVEDSVSIGFSFVNGAIGSFILSDVAASNKSWEMTSQENPSYSYHPTANCYHFAGTNGSLDFPTLNCRYYEEGTDPSWWNEFTYSKQSYQLNDPLEEQLIHFENVVLNGVKPIVSAKTGYMNMRVIEAINQSISDGVKIKVTSV